MYACIVHLCSTVSKDVLIFEFWLLSFQLLGLSQAFLFKFEPLINLILGKLEKIGLRMVTNWLN